MMDGKEFLAEQWKGIVGYPSYEVSSHGRVRRIVKGHHLAAGDSPKQHTTEDGYKCVALGNHIPFKVADLVASSFLGPKPNGYQTHHIDEDKTNNWVYNLKYVPTSEHLRDYKLKKLTVTQIEKVKALRTCGINTKEVAKLTGLSVGLISNIVTGKREAK
jgi:hypothetical protein